MLGPKGLLGTEKKAGEVKFTFNQSGPAALGEQPANKSDPGGMAVAKALWSKGPLEDHQSHLPASTFLFSLAGILHWATSTANSCFYPWGEPTNNQSTMLKQTMWEERERESARKREDKNQRSEQTESNQSAGHFITTWRHSVSEHTDGYGIMEVLPPDSEWAQSSVCFNSLRTSFSRSFLDFSSSSRHCFILLFSCFSSLTSSFKA